MILLIENIFIIYFTLNLYFISRKLSSYHFQHEKNETVILIFLLIIICVSYVIFLLITLNLYTNYLIYVISLISLTSTFFFVSDIKKLSLNSIIKNKIFLLFIPFFVISLLPASDPDSLDYHLGVAKFWIENQKNQPLENWLHFRLASYGETLNIFSILLFGGKWLSFLKVFLVFIITKIIYENYKIESNFNFFLYSFLGSPILVYFISNQKPQFFGFIILITCILLLNLKTNKSFIPILMAYVSSLKFSFIPIVFLIFIYIFFLKNFNKIKLIKIFSFFIFLFWSPILIKNYYFYGNPMSPFFESFLSKSPNDTVINFSNMLRNFSEFGYSGFNQVANIFIPLNFGAITTSFGVSIFFLFFLKFNKKNISELLFLSLIIVLVYFFIGQYSTRYIYLSYFLIIFSFIFCDFKLKKILSFTLICQTISIYIFLVFVSLQNFPSLINEEKNKEYLLDKAYQYKEAEWIREVVKNENYLSDIRSKYFLENNHFSIEFAFYTPEKELNSKLLNFLKKNRINKISLLVDNNHVYNKFNNCKKNLTTKSFKIARRNFLTKDKFIQREIFDLDITNKYCSINL